MSEPAALTDLARRLLDGAYVATVASLEADGSPQLSAIWLKRDGDTAVFSTLAGRRKAKNWEHDDRAALLIVDPEATEHYVELRGRVSVVDDPGGSLIHELARKYTGSDYTGDIDGRVIVTLTPERVISH